MQMRFVECIDYGDAPAITITGVASVSLISPSQVQIALYQTRELPDGTIENRIIEYQIWDLTLWIDNASRFRQAIEAAQNGGLPVSGKAAQEIMAARH
jgi:hypothetical protein